MEKKEKKAVKKSTSSDRQMQTCGCFIVDPCGCSCGCFTDPCGCRYSCSDLCC